MNTLFEAAQKALAEYDELNKQYDEGMGTNIDIGIFNLAMEELRLTINDSRPLEGIVSMQKAEIEQQENFMKTLKDIYKADDMVEMQTLIEIYFENIDSCLINKYNYESNVSLLSD